MAWNTSVIIVLFKAFLIMLALLVVSEKRAQEPIGSVGTNRQDGFLLKRFSYRRILLGASVFFLTDLFLLSLRELLPPEVLHNMVQSLSASIAHTFPWTFIPVALAVGRREEHGG
ncbi:hypothetical protein AN963_10205 [Brevibacillus choshinensis]|uniref:Uncharacterized protein n=1 Tax=Brevibacillus choshinensis TaxID=54911 RepID=A0ABR5NEP4_BRECH|nr:hypothetical protein AN963_10205 [Brevibacillus choshinensis]